MQKNSGIALASRPKFQRNPFVEVGLIILITGLFFWFIVLPKQAEVSAKQKQLSDLQAQETQIAGALTSTQNLIQQIQNDPEDVNLLDASLPLSNNKLDFQILLQNLATRVGVTLGNTNVSGTLTAGNTNLLNNPFGQTRSLQTLTGTVLVTGNFNQLEAFIKQLEHSGRIMDISSLSITPVGNGILGLNVNLKSYYFAPTTP